MRYFYFILLWTALVLCSCFETRFDDTEEKRLQRIKDSLRTDSINYKRSQPDTTYAIYKRTAFCDTVHVVVFDRVKQLAGKEASEYARRHKRFGNTDEIIVNQNVELETLKVPLSSTILLIDDGDGDEADVITEIDDGDTIRYRRHKPADLAEGLPKEELVLLVVQYRSIVYLKQLPKIE